MSAPNATSRARPHAWHLAACLMLVAFLLRSLIPAGFMPAGTDSANGGMAFDICYSGIAHLNAAGPDDAPGPEATDTCPFGLYSQPLTGLPDTPGVLPVQTISAAVLPLPLPRIKPAAIHGPPVGSRAPPLSSFLSA